MRVGARVRIRAGVRDRATVAVRASGPHHGVGRHALKCVPLMVASRSLAPEAHLIRPSPWRTILLILTLTLTPTLTLALALEGAPGCHSCRLLGRRSL